MSDINIALEEQTGGWFNVQIIPLNAIINCPDILTNTNAYSFSFSVAPENHLEILPVGENITISEPFTRTRSGIIYNIRSQFLINYHKADIDSYFNNYINQKVVLIGKKHYGQQKLYGSKKYPLHFKYEFINGKNYQDGSNIRVTVYGKIPQKPVFIND